MALTVTISAITCGLTFVVTVIKPSVSIRIKGKTISLGTYWMISLLGALALLAAGALSLDRLWEGITADTAVNPLKILALFISMTALSVFLDEMGFFGYIASKSVSKAGGQKRFFIKLYIIISLLTVFTSNDIVVLTFTPFICCYAKNAKVNPIPYLVAEFVAANSLSLMLIIGNPTNIYLATFCGISFGRYFVVMLLPAIFAGISGFAVTYLIFRQKLSAPIEVAEVECAQIKDKGMLIVGVAALAACTLLLAVSSYIGLEMWYIAVGFAVALLLVMLVWSAAKRSKPVCVGRTLRRLPVELVPFVLSMFGIVLALNSCGVTQKLGEFLDMGKFSGVSYGIGSFLFANLINNIPMSVLFGSVTSYASAASVTHAVYASIVGSNIGAFLTPMGALAGIMWLNILKEKEVKFGFLDFIKYGVIISLPALASSVLGLYISLALF